MTDRSPDRNGDGSRADASPAGADGSGADPPEGRAALGPVDDPGSEGSVVVDGMSLSPAAVERVARDGATVTVPAGARERVRESRQRVVDVVDSGEPVYGVTTGFGDLVDCRISGDDVAVLQRNLVRSHAAGTGETLDRAAVRATLITRLNALLVGHSGVRERVVDLLVGLLNEGVHPVVPAAGSLGASGDLAPLAHVALVLIGEGEATVDGERLPGGEALSRAGLAPVELRAKEGLALINGTQLTLGLAALTLRDAERAIRAADVAGAMTTEATLSTTATAHPSIQRVRPHPGQADSAAVVRQVTRGSEIVQSHRNCDRVQDPYSIRCLPQVHGAVRDAVAHLRAVVETELNSATDNPLVFGASEADDRASGTDSAGVLSGGNFHGAPLAHRLDYAAGALADLAAICERRVDRLLNPSVQPEHLPPFLTEHSGLRSGYMIAQYAAADLASTSRGEGRPAADTVPVSGNQEDHVSMSAQSARRARATADRTLRVVATELACATQALEFLPDREPGAGTAAAYAAVRDRVPPLDEDRPVGEDVATTTELIRSDGLLDRVAGAVDGDLP